MHIIFHLSIPQARAIIEWDVWAFFIQRFVMLQKKMPYDFFLMLFLIRNMVVPSARQKAV